MAKKKPTSGQSITDVLGTFRAPRTSVPVTMRADLLADHAELARRYEAAVSDDFRGAPGAANAPKLAAQLLDLEAQIEASQVTVVLEALPHELYRALVEDHPPVDEAHAFNPVTFLPALLARCATDPVMDLDQATELLARSTTGQHDLLVAALIDLNMDVPVAPKSLLLSDVAAPSATSSSSAAPAGSPAASS